MPPSSPPDAQDADDALAARLQALAERRQAAAAASGPRSSSSASGPRSSPPASRSGRRHPARRARTVAVGVSVVSTAGLTGLFMVTALGGPNQLSSAAVVTPIGNGAAGGTVDGGIFHNRWGDVQVEVTFGADGSITEVTALRVPGGRGTSIQINRRAVPRLTDETLSIQSADVHTVSGATYTSKDYRRSLQSAIDEARAAGITTLP